MRQNRHRITDAKTRALFWPIVVAVVVLLTGCGGEQSSSQSDFDPEELFTEELWNFDEDPPGGIPEGAEVFSGTWEVRPEPGAPTEPNVLCQIGEAEFP